MKLSRLEELEGVYSTCDPQDIPEAIAKMRGFKECWDIVESIIALTQRIVSDEYSLIDDERGECLFCGGHTGYHEDTHYEDCELVALRTYLGNLKFAEEEKEENE